MPRAGTAGHGSRRGMPLFARAQRLGAGCSARIGAPFQRLPGQRKGSLAMSEPGCLSGAPGL